jgi:hypothetical protein
VNSFLGNIEDDCILISSNDIFAPALLGAQVSTCPFMNGIYRRPVVPFYNLL